MNENKQLWSGRVQPNGEREIFEPTFIKDVDQPNSIIKGLGGAVIHFEGNLRDELVNSGMAPLGCIPTRNGVTMVFPESVLLIEPGADEVTMVVDETFFHSVYKKYTPPVEAEPETPAKEAFEEFLEGFDTTELDEYIAKRKQREKELREAQKTPLNEERK